MLAPVPLLVTILAGYLLGSIPVANLVAGRRTGTDLRTVGDRNPGYWNAKETLGRRRAVPVFVGDVAKGTAAATVGLLAASVAGGTAIGSTAGSMVGSVGAEDRWWLPYVGTAAAMVGHAFPVLAGFRGGRSVLAFAGGAVVCTPMAAAVAVAVLLAVFGVTRHFAVAARVGFVVLPVAQLAIEGPHRTAATGALMTFIGLRFAQAAWSSRTRGPATAGDT